MAEKDQEQQAGTDTPGTDGETINDPLTHGDEDAPRKEFEGDKSE